MVLSVFEVMQLVTVITLLIFIKLIFFFFTEKPPLKPMNHALWISSCLGGNVNIQIVLIASFGQHFVWDYL